MLESFIRPDNDDSISAGPNVSHNAQYTQIEFFDFAALKNGQAIGITPGLNFIHADILGLVYGGFAGRLVTRLDGGKTAEALSTKTLGSAVAQKKANRQEAQTQPESCTAGGF